MIYFDIRYFFSSYFSTSYEIWSLRKVEIIIGRSGSFVKSELGISTELGISDSKIRRHVGSSKSSSLSSFIDDCYDSSNA